MTNSMLAVSHLLALYGFVLLSCYLFALLSPVATAPHEFRLVACNAWQLFVLDPVNNLIPAALLSQTLQALELSSPDVFRAAIERVDPLILQQFQESRNATRGSANEQQ
jgi:peptidoglycan biosynthesis protein MviN/MurJ (putative lipid II flippase)